MSNTADNTASSSNTAGIGESTTAPRRPNNTDNTNASAMGTAAASTTMTMTVAPPQNDNDRVLPLTLVNRPSVTWEEGTIDNENMGKKSSKRCCIFHKPRAFGESSTDTSDYDSDGKYGSNNKKIARKKTPGKKKTPDHLRFHA